MELGTVVDGLIAMAAASPVPSKVCSDFGFRAGFTFLNNRLVKLTGWHSFLTHGKTARRQVSEP